MFERFILTFFSTTLYLVQLSAQDIVDYQFTVYDETLLPHDRDYLVIINNTTNDTLSFPCKREKEFYPLRLTLGSYTIKISDWPSDDYAILSYNLELTEETPKEIIILKPKGAYLPIVRIISPEEQRDYAKNKRKLGRMTRKHKKGKILILGLERYELDY